MFINQIISKIGTIRNKALRKVKFYYSINYTKSLYFNIRMFGLVRGWKLPVVFFGKVQFRSLDGVVKIPDNARFMTIMIGLNTDMFTDETTGTLLTISGSLIFYGPAVFSVNNTIFIKPEAIIEIGDCCAFGNNIKMSSYCKIKIGRVTRVASESQLFDSNFHFMKDTQTGKVFRSDKEIIIGAYNWIGNRTTVMKGVKTPDWCTITSNSLLNKDYTDVIPEESIIGGAPAKLIKTNIVRIFNIYEENEIAKYFQSNSSANEYIASIEKREIKAKKSEISYIFKD